MNPQRISLTPFSSSKRSREQYLEHIRRAYVGRRNQGLSVEEALFSSEGAFPADVLEAIDAHYGRIEPLVSIPFTRSSDWRTADPDLIQSEWYFTDQSADGILDRWLNSTDTLVALGCPSVATRAARRGIRTVLVDNSPWLEMKRPQMRFIRMSAAAHWADHVDRDGPVVVLLDPPWHSEDYQAWLASVFESVKLGDRILVVAPQALSLRSALEIRSMILRELGRFGSVGVVPEAVTYRTPLFEASMLRAMSLPAPNWRKGDIFEVVVNQEPAKMAATNEWHGRETEWRAFNIAGTVVRTTGIPDGGVFSVLSPDALVLPSPSFSLIEREGYNCVSSHGIAMRVAGLGVLERVLLSVSIGRGLRDAVRSEHLTGHESNALTRAIEDLTGRRLRFDA